MPKSEVEVRNFGSYRHLVCLLGPKTKMRDMQPQIPKSQKLDASLERAGSDIINNVDI